MQRSKTRVEAVVFDMDGVIFDTEQLVLKGWTDVGEKHGIKGTDEACKRSFGTNHEVSKQTFLEFFGQEFPYDEYKQEVREYFFKSIETEVPMKKGIREILMYLREKNFKIGLASSCTKATILKELDKDGLTEYFDVVIGGDLLKKSKPEADIYLMACSKLNVNPENAYAIEDSYNGIRSAYSAGMKPIMVPDIMPPTDEMRKKSVVICKDLLEAMDYIEKFRVCGE